jgi:hypothetical protein
MAVLDQVQVIDREEGRRLLDEEAQRCLQISGEEFLRRWDAGEYRDDERLAVARVAMLIHFVR